MKLIDLTESADLKQAIHALSKQDQCYLIHSMSNAIIENWTQDDWFDFCATYLTPSEDEHNRGVTVKDPEALTQEERTRALMSKTARSIFEFEGLGVKTLLQVLKNGHFDDGKYTTEGVVKILIRVLRKMGKDSPELSTIEKSVK